MLEQILSNTHTTEELYSRIALLREALEAYLFKGVANDAGSTAEGVRRFIAQSEADVETKEAVEEWGDDLFNAFTQDNLYEELQKLWDAADDFPRLTLYVPINLHGESAASVGKWARGNLGERVILDIHIEPSVVAGATFVWQGKSYDYSVRKLLRNKREEIKQLVSDS